MHANVPVQFDHNGKLRHFLTIQGLSEETLTGILDIAHSFIDFGKREIKKIPLMRGKTVVFRAEHSNTHHL